MFGLLNFRLICLGWVEFSIVCFYLFRMFCGCNSLADLLVWFFVIPISCGFCGFV